MNTPSIFKLWGRLLLCSALLLVSTLNPIAVAQSSGGAGADSSQQTFLGSIADKTTEVGDHPLTSGATKAAEEAEKAFKRALEAGLASEKYVKSLERMGKYVKVVDAVFKIIKFGDLGAHCYAALASGDRTAFAKAFNEAIKEAVKTLAGMGGAAAGAAAGGTAGALAGGGIASIITGGVGAFLGGWAGDYLASEGAGAAYNAFLSDWVKNDLSNMIFDGLGAGGKGSGPLLPPPLTGSGGGGNTGGQGGSKGGWKGMDKY